jgi:acyl-CoA thioester hydrolase
MIITKDVTMSKPFETTFRAGWGMMDFNAHMANRAYLDMAADTRMMFFESVGFSMREFEKHAIGPVVNRDELEYFKEIRLLEPVRVELLLAGLALDGSRMRMRNVFYRPDGKEAARLTSSAGWLDLRARKLTVPPTALYEALASLPHTDDYEDLPAIKTKSE